MAPRARATVLMCGGKPGVLAALAAVAVMRARKVAPRMRWLNWTQVGFSVTFRSAGLKPKFTVLKKELVHILNPPPINIFFRK